MNRAWIVTLVVGTLAAVVVLYMVTLMTCAICGIVPPDAIPADMKELGLVALGALSSLLAKTSETPQETKIVNTPEQPVPTVEK